MEKKIKQIWCVSFSNKGILWALAEDGTLYKTDDVDSSTPDWTEVKVPQEE